jgi:hypothetical protein
MKLDRKEFIRTALVMAGAGFGLTRLAGCGGGDAPPGNSTGTAGTGGGVTNACATHDPVETIAANHGHVLTVTAADAAAGQLKMYSIKGTAAHDHSVTVSPQMFTTLNAGQTVTTTSTNGAGHTHGITIVCA